VIKSNPPVITGSDGCLGSQGISNLKQANVKTHKSA